MTSIDIHGVVDKLEPGKEKYAKALKTAEESFHECHKIFNDPDYINRSGWKAEIDRPDVKIHSKQYPFGNVFALSALAKIPIDFAFRECFVLFDDIPKWDSMMLYAKIVTALTDHVDIVHYANPSLLTVKSRDYVAVRIWRKIDNVIYAGGKSIDLGDELPATKQHVRAKLHMGCGQFTPDKLDPNNKTQIEYIMSIDMKGYIPKAIVNAVMAKIMVKDFEDTTKRFAEIMENLKDEH